MDAKAKNGKPTRRDDGPKAPAGGVAMGVSGKRATKKPAKPKVIPAPSVAQAVPPPPKRKSGPNDPLTENELRFCHEYVIDHNATQAYLNAFPGCNYLTARTNASKLLAKANIAAEVAAVEREHLRSLGVTAKRVLREIAAIAFSDPLDLVEEDGVSPRTLNKVSAKARRALQRSKVKRRIQQSLDGDWVIEEIDYQTYDKLAALDKLAKHLGLTGDGEALRQLLELVGKGNGPGTDPANSAPQPTEGGVDGPVDSTDGPTGDEAATNDRPADKAIPANG